MKYNQPFGVTNPDAGYVNGDPSIGQRGSIPPMEAVEYPQREIVNVIAASGQVPSNGDLMQLLKAIKFFGGNIKNGIDAGTKNEIVVDLDPAPNSYAKLFCLVQKMGTANDDIMTIVVNGMAQKSLKDLGGAELSPGALVGGGVYLLWYDGTQMRVLGGSASYSTVSGLTASGGEVIDVTVSGVVNANYDKPTHNATFDIDDILVRKLKGGGVHVKYTLGELLDWIGHNIAPPDGEDPIWFDPAVRLYKAKASTRTARGVARRATSTEVTNRAATGGAVEVFIGPEDLPSVDAFGYGVGQSVELVFPTTTSLAPIGSERLFIDEIFTGAQMKAGPGGAAYAIFGAALIPRLGVTTKYKGTLPADAASYRITGIRVASFFQDPSFGSGTAYAFAVVAFKRES